MSSRIDRNPFAFEPFAPRPQPAPSLVSRGTGLIYSIFAKIFPRTSTPPETLLTFEQLPDCLKIKLLQHFDLPALAQFSRTSKETNGLISDHQIWRSFAERINCPIDPKSTLPVYKQVIAFIELIQNRVRRLNEAAPADVKGVLMAPTLDQIDLAQKWLDAHRTVLGYHRLMKIWTALPQFQLEIPDVRCAKTLSGETAKAKELREWTETNKSLFQDLDTLQVWKKLAMASGLQAPRLDDLRNREDVHNRAAEFNDWFHLHKETLIALTELDLWGLPITSIPKEIGELINLTSLKLGSNWLIELPEWIGNLTKLTYLDLSSNHLISIPPQIGKLAKLQMLRLSTNRLSFLPPEIGNLLELIDLELTGNQFCAFPTVLLNLPCLEVLNLGRNCLNSIPPQIQKLTRLEELDISNNFITSLPREVGTLLNLTSFNCCRNFLTELPDELFSLPPNLTKVVFVENNFPIAKELAYIAKGNSKLTLLCGTAALAVVGMGLCEIATIATAGKIWEWSLWP